MTEPIPVEILEAARRKLKRSVAAMIVQMMAESDMDFAAIDERVGTKAGTAKRYVYRLINCTTTDMETLSDLCVAMGYEPHFSARARPKPEPKPEPASAEAAAA